MSANTGQRCLPRGGARGTAILVAAEPCLSLLVRYINIIATQLLTSSDVFLYRIRFSLLDVRFSISLLLIPMTCTTTCVEIQDDRYLRTFGLCSEEGIEGVISDLEYAQSISGSNIDSRKLSELLRIKFGAGAFNIHVGVFPSEPIPSTAN